MGCNLSTPSLPKKLDELTAAFCWASGTKVVWKNQKKSPRGREPVRPWLELSILSIPKLGVDESRYIYNETTQEQKLYQIGQRQLRIQVDARSRSQEHADSAWFLAENTRTRIDALFVASKWLDSNDMSIERTTDVLDIGTGFEHDNRVEDVAHFEIHLNTIISESDFNDAMSNNYIESVEVSSNLKNAGGEPLAASLQMDREVINGS